MKSKKYLKKFMICYALVFAAGIAHSEEDKFQFKDKIAQMVESCAEHAGILVDAQFNKWTKLGRNPDLLNTENYQILKKVKQQQCVSVQLVSIMRMMKSQISASEALRLNIDAEIEKQMLIIEKAL